MLHRKPCWRIERFAMRHLSSAFGEDRSKVAPQ